MQRLILFDIDETIISSDGTGRRAIGKALCNVFGIETKDMQHVRMSGKTDPQILSEIFKAAGKQEEEMAHKVDDMFTIYLALLEDEIGKATENYRIHKGVVELLEALERHEHGFLGLLTGNIEQGARMKLGKFDLNKYFPLGAYGSDSADRMQLPKIAQDRAREHYDIEFAPEKIVIVGDSIYDVLCAKGFGARSIAVNTGVTPKEDLEEQNPDYLFDSLADTESVLKAIFA